MKNNQAKVWIKADGEGNVSKVVDFGKSSVEIPVNNDGSVKWFDDTKLLKGNHKNQETEN